VKGCGCCVPWLRVGGPGAGGRGQGAGVASGDSRRMVHDTVNRGGGCSEHLLSGNRAPSHSLSRNEDTSTSSPIFTPKHR